MCPEVWLTGVNWLFNFLRIISLLRTIANYGQMKIKVIARILKLSRYIWQRRSSHLTRHYAESVQHFRYRPWEDLSASMNREVQFCFAIPRSEPFPPVKRSSPIHSFAIQDILGLGEKNSKPKESSPQNQTLAECFSPIGSRLENPSLEAEKTAIISG